MSFPISCRKNAMLRPPFHTTNPNTFRKAKRKGQRILFHHQSGSTKMSVSEKG